jgi:hypothetical protein
MIAHFELTITKNATFFAIKASLAVVRSFMMLQRLGYFEDTF